MCKMVNYKLVSCRIGCNSKRLELDQLSAYKGLMSKLWYIPIIEYYANTCERNEGGNSLCAGMKRFSSYEMLR